MSTFVWELGRRGLEGSGIGFVKMTDEARRMVPQVLRQRNTEEIQKNLGLFSTKEEAEESDRVVGATEVVSFLEELKRDDLAARGITLDPDCEASLPCSLQVSRACMKNFRLMVKDGERGSFGLNLVLLRREDFPSVSAVILERSKKAAGILGVEVLDTHILFALCKQCKEDMMRRGEAYKDYGRTISVARLKKILEGMAERRDEIASLARVSRTRPDYNARNRHNGNENEFIPQRPPRNGDESVPVEKEEDEFSGMAVGVRRGGKKNK